MNGHSHPGGHGAAVHGMLIFGDGPIYLSHLPMFQPPHDLQLIVEVEFSGAGDPADVYRRDRAETREKIYTWVPQAFVLEDLLQGAPGTARMTGRIVRGHFERGGEPIARDVTCVVSRVIHSRPLSAAGPRDASLSYVLFGSAAHAFAVHLISGPPDFDQVVSVDAGQRPAGSATTVVVQDRPNDATGRLQPGDRVQVSDSAGRRTAQCLDEIYVETGELAS